MMPDLGIDTVGYIGLVGGGLAVVVGLCFGYKMAFSIIRKAIYWVQDALGCNEIYGEPEDDEYYDKKNWYK